MSSTDQRYTKTELDGRGGQQFSNWEVFDFWSEKFLIFFLLISLVKIANILKVLNFPTFFKILWQALVFQLKSIIEYLRSSSHLWYTPGTDDGLTSENILVTSIFILIKKDTFIPS